jgi:hypothetical protein
LVKIKALKIKTLVVGVCLLFITKAFSQSYIPFVSEEKLWTEANSGCNPNFITVQSYVMRGDTLIDTLVFKKVCDLNNAIILLVYEDTTQRKVYFRYPYDNTSFLLYDFNLQIGDTLPAPECQIVIDRTTEYFAGRNRIKLTFDWPMTWYEGIGCVNHYIFYWRCIVGGVGSLLCYFENDILLYHDTNINNDCFVNYNMPPLEKENLFDLYCSYDIMHLKSKSNTPYTLSVYDLFGREILQISATGDMRKDVSNLPAGMYLWRVESKEVSGVFSGKFLKN